MERGGLARACTANQIGAQGAAELAGALKANKTLTTLKLGSAPLSPAALWLRAVAALAWRGGGGRLAAAHAVAVVRASRSSAREAQWVGACRVVSSRRVRPGAIGWRPASTAVDRPAWLAGAHGGRGCMCVCVS